MAIIQAAMDLFIMDIMEIKLFIFLSYNKLVISDKRLAKSAY